MAALLLFHTVRAMILDSRGGPRGQSLNKRLKRCSYFIGNKHFAVQYGKMKKYKVCTFYELLLVNILILMILPELPFYRMNNVIAIPLSPFCFGLSTTKFQVSFSYTTSFNYYLHIIHIFI